MWYSDRAVYWRDEMLKTTYRNLYLLKRISEATSTYRRDKFLNDWVVSQSIQSGLLLPFTHL